VSVVSAEYLAAEGAAAARLRSALHIHQTNHVDLELRDVSHIVSILRT
jgi:hypothetical protein